MKYIIVIGLLLVCMSPVFASSPDYLIIPSISLTKTVSFIPDSDLSPASHYYDLDDLGYGVGYLEGLTWGSTVGGRTILVGHTPGAFKRLNELNIGDEIILSMNNDYHTFEIFNIYVTHKSDNSLFEDAPPTYEVVLVTCIDAEYRLIVKAR